MPSTISASIADYELFLPTLGSHEALHSAEEAKLSEILIPT